MECASDARGTFKKFNTFKAVIFMNYNTPSFAGKPLTSLAFKKWISDAERTPAIPLNVARQKWESKRKLLQKLTR